MIAAREVNGVHPFVFGGELIKRCARFVWHSEKSEPLSDHRCENVHTGEKRLRLHRCGQRPECRLLLAADGMHHSRHHVQQYRDGRVNVSLNDFPTAAEPTLSLLELAHPHRYAGKRPESGREHRAIAQAIALGEGLPC